MATTRGPLPGRRVSASDIRSRPTASLSCARPRTHRHPNQSDKGPRILVRRPALRRATRRKREELLSRSTSAGKLVRSYSRALPPRWGQSTVSALTPDPETRAAELRRLVDRFLADLSSHGFRVDDAMTELES